DLHATGQWRDAQGRLVLVDPGAVAAGLFGQGHHTSVRSKQSVIGLVAADRALGQLELWKAPHDLVAVRRLEGHAGGLVCSLDLAESEGFGSADIESAYRAQEGLCTLDLQVAP